MMTDTLEKNETENTATATSSDDGGRLCNRPEPAKLCEGELLANSTRGKLRLFMVRERRVKPDYYLLMELSNLSFKWVSAEEMNEWIEKKTFVIFTPDGLPEARKKYEWELSKEYWEKGGGK